MQSLEERITSAAQVLDHIITESRYARLKKGLPPAAHTSAMRAMQEKVWVNAHWPIAWPKWPPGLVAKLQALVQKVIRASLAWYINPIVKQQNEFNQTVLTSMRVLSREIQDLRALHVEDRREIETLRAQLAALQTDSKEGA
ncbi:MAG: hypothetical protein JW981_09855 [Anaerolineae bacterium]|nr:hypothetical protein [Anaerolineae bacterium]